MLSGANQLTQIAGPVLAGVLIAATSAAAVLVVDAGTYVFSFLTILTVVRAGGRVEQTPESKGLLAGLRFLARDRLLGPLLLAACAINFVAQGVIIGVQALAYFRLPPDAHVVGFLFGGFGAGALLGALAAQQLALEGRPDEDGRLRDPRDAGADLLPRASRCPRRPRRSSSAASASPRRS